MREILEEFLTELDDRDATELASVDSWADELRSHLADRVRTADER